MSGLFIHWGVYMLGDGEWVMNQQQIPVATYEKLPGFSTRPILMRPLSGTNGERCRMKYITITSKHHDGFAMWDNASVGLQHCG